MTIAERTDRTKFRNQALKPMLDDDLLETTIPDKPARSKQRYRTTERGRTPLAAMNEGDE
jgi:ATP-dependent DNA helicase RecG